MIVVMDNGGEGEWAIVNGESLICRDPLSVLGLRAH
jgi:hypothetical protein